MRKPQASGGARRHAEKAGPVFLFALLCSALVPSALTEFDASRLISFIQAAIVALAQPSHSFVSGEERPSGAPASLACGSAGFQVADSAAPVFDACFAPRAPATGLARRRAKPAGKRRARGANSPRAPPAFSIPHSTAQK
jgi:hypothetical protein